MKITKDFSRHEFLTSRFFTNEETEKVQASYSENSFNLAVNMLELANNLQVLRDHFNSVVSINIAYRPRWYELDRGRKGTSRHVDLIAADIVVKGHSPKEVADAIVQLIDSGEMKEGGIGRYNTFTHYDIRGTKARWGAN